MLVTWPSWRMSTTRLRASWERSGTPTTAGRIPGSRRSWKARWETSFCSLLALLFSHCFSHQISLPTIYSFWFQSKMKEKIKELEERIQKLSSSSWEYERMKLLERAGEVDQLRREEEMLHSQLDRLKQEVGIWYLLQYQLESWPTSLWLLLEWSLQTKTGRLWEGVQGPVKSYFDWHVQAWVRDQKSQESVSSVNRSVHNVFNSTLMLVGKMRALAWSALSVISKTELKPPQSLLIAGGQRWRSPTKER